VIFGENTFNPLRDKDLRKRKEDLAGERLAEECGKEVESLLPRQSAAILLDSEDGPFQERPNASSDQAASGKRSWQSLSPDRRRFRQTVRESVQSHIHGRVQLSCGRVQSRA